MDTAIPADPLFPPFCGRVHGHKWRPVEHVLYRWSLSYQRPQCVTPPCLLSEEIILSVMKRYSGVTNERFMATSPPSPHPCCPDLLLAQTQKMELTCQYSDSGVPFKRLLFKIP